MAVPRLGCEHVSVDFYADDAQPRGHIWCRGRKQPFEGWLELFVLLRSAHEEEPDHQDRTGGVSGDDCDLGPVVDFYLVGLRTEVRRAVDAARTGDERELAAAQEQFRWLLERLRLSRG